MIDMHEYVVNGLQARKGTWRIVAEDIGMSRSTLEKVATRDRPNPSIKTVQKIANWLYEQENQ